ncbi:MAG: aminotransferase [Candidatus Sericytochromatia bacterium]|nr:MAG: aminotransferase [Candidatus Sericytochromatia bacterium]
MKYVRMPIESESPEQYGYNNIKCNLSESSFTDSIFRNLDININELILCYGNHLGKYELRELIANENKNILPENVLLTVGAASALFIISTSLLEKDSHIIVLHPNYATNIETPKAIQCNIDYINLNFDEKFELDIDLIKKKLKHNTKYISLTYPHNPTGKTLSLKKLEEIIEIAEKNNVYILYDETYRDMSFQETIPLAADLSDKCISVSSLSKTYGLPGIRTGWIICKDKKLMELFLAAKEQIFICNSVIDEEIAYLFYLKKDKYLPDIKNKILNRFKILKNWMNNNKYMEWVEPQGGVVAFPRIKKDIDIDLEKFYFILKEKYKTFVGPGHWFDMDKRYMRVGYGYPDEEELKEGLYNIEKSILETIY